MKLLDYAYLDQPTQRVPAIQPELVACYSYDVLLATIRAQHAQQQQSARQQASRQTTVWRAFYRSQVSYE